MSNVIAKIGMLESKKFGIYFLSFLLFSGCSFIDEPVRGFFKEYTETAAIERHEYAEAVAIDRYGIDCLSSEKDKEIYLYLRNPQLYDLELKIVSVSGEVADPAKFSIVQNPDKISSTITLKESFLTSFECGRDFSPTISVVEKKYRRKFADYTFALKINSVPPVPYGAVVLITSDSDPKYVLCFNLPGKADLKGIHRDIKTLTIESNGSVPKRKIFLTPDSSGAVSIASDENGAQISDVKTSVTDGKIKENNQTGAAGLGFTAGENPVYVFTGDGLVDIASNISYKITLEDNDGLSSTASTSVYSQKLEKPTATAVGYKSSGPVELNDASFTEIVQNEDGAGYVKLILPTSSTTGLSVSSCSVVYEILPASEDKVIGRGTVNSSMEIPVPPFECKIKAYAENPAYVPSDLAWFHVKPVCTKLYVDEGGSARSDGGWGTKKKPFNKITTALEADLFAVKTDSENRIILLSNLQDENINLDEKYCFTLTSQNTGGNTAVHTITPISLSSSSDFMSLGYGSSVFIENVCIKNFAGSSNDGVFSVADANLHLTNVELTDNKAPLNGGVLYLNDSKSFVILSGKTSVSSEKEDCGFGAYIANKNARLYVTEDSYLAQNCVVYLCDDAVLSASALCTADKIACIQPSEYPENPAETKVKLLEASDPNALDGDFCNSRFTVAQNPGSDLEYYVVYSDDDRCGILAKGTSANVTTALPDTVIFHQLYFKGIYLTFYATDGRGKRLTPQKSSVKVKLRSDVLSSETKENEYIKHKIPSEIEELINEDGKIDGEKVTVELSVRVSGIVYSATEDIVVSSAINDTASFANAVDFINTLDDSSDQTVDLAADIVVTDSTPLLGTSEHKFNGVFDGHGHTITLSRTAQGRTAAIADFVGPKGVIRNVVIAGNYNNTNDTKAGVQTGGVVAENEGLIINCVNYLNITVESVDDSGGIAFVNRGKIVNCANFGNIANNTYAYWAGIYGKVGGITGRNDGQGLIENCFNCGIISSTCTDDVTVATNGLPGAITGSQSGTAKGHKCYWKEGCVKRGNNTNNEAYNSYAFKNSKLSFFWSYSVNTYIVESSKNNETFITSCGTFADADSEIVAGTEKNSEREQTLTYTGRLLDVMNSYVNANSYKYRFNNTDIEMLEWKADSDHEGYPRLKF